MRFKQPKTCQASLLFACTTVSIQLQLTTNLKSKHKLDRSASGNDAVTGMVDEQEVHDTQQSHESCRK